MYYVDHCGVIVDKHMESVGRSADVTAGWTIPNL